MSNSSSNMQHTLMLGTTRAGKSCFADLIMRDAIENSETVMVICVGKLKGKSALTRIFTQLLREKNNGKTHHN